MKVERARVDDVPVVRRQKEEVGCERTGSRPRVEKVVQFEVIQRKRDRFGVERVLVAPRHVEEGRVPERRLGPSGRPELRRRLEDVTSGLDLRKESLEVAKI